MVERGIIQRIGRGIFILGETLKFYPEIDISLKKKYKNIKTEFPFIDICVWDTSVFNEFSLHQTNRRFILIETEKEVTEPVFHFLKEQYINVFLDPNREVLEQYVYDILNPVIVIPLLSEAPLQMVNKIQTLTIEKMLVDLYCDVDLFDLFQGNEKNIIYSEAFKKYTINNSKLLRYASRRGKKEEIEKYITQIIGNPIR